jgi:hypothetical protein
MTTTHESWAKVPAISAMDARAQIVKMYGIDQRTTKVEAVKVAPGQYRVSWREATR